MSSRPKWSAFTQRARAGPLRGSRGLPISFRSGRGTASAAAGDTTFKASRVIEPLQVRFGVLRTADEARVRTAADAALDTMWDRLEQAQSLAELLEWTRPLDPAPHDGGESAK